MKKIKELLSNDDFTEENYHIFKKKLFSDSTPLDEVGRICMTLAHLPSKRAQDLLASFKESANAHKVKWLDLAIEEGQFVYLSPQNEQEDRDYMALKVIQEMQDEVLDLEIKLNEAIIDIDTMKIKHEAIKELVKKGEIDAEEELGLNDVMLLLESKVDDLNQDIERNNKIFLQITKSIKIKRYKDVDPSVMRDIHFC